MVTPQQRKQVIVKSIGEIERDSTVRARPMGSRAEKVATAAAFGNSIGEGISGIGDYWDSGLDSMKTGLGWYSSFAQSKPNWLVIGLAYGNEQSRRFVVPQKEISWVGNIPNYVFTAHVLYSTVQGLLGMRK